MLGWNAVPGLGPLRIQRLVAAAGSARAAASAPAQWWKAAGRGAPPPPSANELRALSKDQRAAAARFGAQAYAWGDADYPTRLHPPDVEHSFIPAPIVYVVGDSTLLEKGGRTIGVIGARACTPYGREQAARFASGFADAGATVVSGAARGIDQAAMRAAVQARGKVIAVLGSAFDHLYPKDANTLLATVLEAGGAVVSEFAFGTSTRPGNFPRRNRLLAAASDALLVVQASCRSGTMSTCSYALDYGREVFALPGEVDCPVSAGTHALIRDGCALALSPAEVLHEFERSLPPEALGRADPAWEALAGGPLTSAELAQRLGSTEAALAQKMVDLELRGLVRRHPGGLYHRSGPKP